MGLLAPLMLLAAAGSAPTQAQDLAYDWPEDEVVHYRIQAFVQAPRVLRFYAAENLDARVAEFTMGLLVKCRKVGEERKSIDVDCDVHRAQLGGMASDGSEQQKLIQIFREYVNALDDATIQLVISPEGRFRSVDIEGLEKGSTRETQIHEDLRMIVMRAMSALEVELPKGAEDPGKAWKQKGAPLAMQLPTRYGTAGAIRMKHEVVGRDGALVNIETVADGTVSPATATSAQSSETGASSGSVITVAMNAAGESVLDTEKGLLLRSELTVQGTLTATSSGVGDGLFVNQFALAEWMENFDQLDAEYEEMLISAMEEPKAQGAESEDARAAEEAAMKALQQTDAEEETEE